MKLLIDVNLSPEWIAACRREGLEAVHWSEIGSKTDDDSVLLNWARLHEHVLVTQDLDFPTLLFAAKTGFPSVVLLRIEDELNDSWRSRVCSALHLHEMELAAGAILVIDENKIRIRRLPL